VQRYKGKGYLWELWNEPNIAQFWKPTPNVADYIALAKATGEALHKAGLIQVMGSGQDGTAGPPTEAFIGPATSTIALPFLEECFKAGLLAYWSAVSVHPYRQTAPETVEEEYRNLRMLIGRYAPKDTQIPIVSGEWGYSSAWKSLGKDEPTREEQQAKYLIGMFRTNIANDVPLSIWYDWRDDGDDPNEGEHRFGIVRREYQQGGDPVFAPKPAYTTMTMFSRRQPAR
jgi:polysaccharide biosynthesis protein PslG